MAFPHPFSASSKPLPSADYWSTTNPLPFAATLNQGPLFSGTDLNGKGKAREREKPRELEQWQDGSAASGRSSLAQALAQLDVQSTRPSIAPRSPGSSSTFSPTPTEKSLPDDDDEELDPQLIAGRKIAHCIALDEPRLDLTGMGLRYLPDDIANMRYIFHLERRTSVSMSGMVKGDGNGVGTGDLYRTPPGSPSADRGISARANIRASPAGYHLRGPDYLRPWARSTSLPASMLPTPTSSIVAPGETKGGPISPWTQNLRGSYSNPLGLGPPPSIRSGGAFGGFLPPGSPVLEQDDEIDDDDEGDEKDGDGSTRVPRRSTSKFKQPSSPLKDRGAVMARRNLTAPASSKLRVRFGAEHNSPDATAGTSTGPGADLARERGSGSDSSSDEGSSSRSRSSSKASSGSKHAARSSTLQGFLVDSPTTPTTPTRSSVVHAARSTIASTVNPTRQARTFASAKSLSAVTFDRSPNTLDKFGGERTMRRTPSGFYERPGETSWSGEGGSDLALYLGHNAIGCLPSSLFLLTNLTVLSLRANKLERLPAGVGQLKRLKELNVSNNSIRSFPPSLLDLSELNVFNCINNPLVRTDSRVEPSGRRLAPLAIKLDEEETTGSQVPSLHSLCLTKLLSTSEPDHMPPLLSRFDWSPEGGDNHALQSPDNLHKHLKYLSLNNCARVIQALRSASDAKQARAHEYSLPDNNSSPVKRRPQRNRKDRQTSLKEDAADNPFFSPCPNPRHYQGGIAKLSKWVYLQTPAEERIQFVEVAGEKNIPIKWEGCCRGCLDFLVEAEPAEQDADGFDVAVLNEDDPIPWATQL